MTKKELKNKMVYEAEVYVRCCNEWWQKYLDSHLEDKTDKRIAEDYRDSACTVAHLMKSLELIKEDEHGAMITDIIKRTCNYNW